VSLGASLLYQGPIVSGLPSVLAHRQLSTHNSYLTDQCTDLSNEDFVDSTLCALPHSCTACLVNAQQLLPCSKDTGDADWSRGAEVISMGLTHCCKLLPLALAREDTMDV